MTMPTARFALVICFLGACSSSSGSNPPTSGANNGAANGSLGGGSSGQTGGDSGGTGASPGSSGGGSSGQGTGASTSGGTSSSSGGTNGQPTGGSSGVSGAAPTGGSGGSCVDVSASATPRPAVLEFQIDTTNSMTRTTTTTGGATKWVATQNALKAALPSLPQEWLVGISFFNKPANVCYTGTQAVDIAPLSQNLNAIISAINGITLDPNTSTWTPTFKAWQFAYDYLTTQWPARAQYARNDKYIIFLTDGIPTVERTGCTVGTSCPNACVSQDEYDYAVNTIAATGVTQARSYFIGVPGSEEQQGAPYDPRVMLSRLAIAGGTAPAGCTEQTAAAGNYCHIDLTGNANFATALAQAIQAIAQQVISCTYKVPPPPDGRIIDPLKIAITYTTGGGQARDLRRATDSSCTDGQWYVSAVDASGTPTDLALCADSCDTVSGDSGASVLVTFACNERL
jgi:hypothetical protein